MTRLRVCVLSLVCLCLGVGVASAGTISIFNAPAGVYQNTINNPCIFFGPGGSACNSNPASLPFVGDTGGGTPFVPNPLVNTYGDAPGEILGFATNVGRDFLLGLDINQDVNAQTLSNLTINFFNLANTNIGTWTIAAPILVPDNANGTGFADYLLGSGGTTANPTPFSAPLGTVKITFTFGMIGFNDGQDKLFLISKEACPGCGPTPFDIPPGAVPEPASLLLLGTGLAGIAVHLRRRATRRAA